MRRLLIPLIAVVMMLGMVSVSQAFLMNFEEGLGKNGDQITGISGVTFTTSGGKNWIYGDATTGLYDVTSVDTNKVWGSGIFNIYGNVFAWLGSDGNWGRIDFDDKNGIWFQIGVSSTTDFTLTAYDEFGNVLDTATTGPCTRSEGYTDMAWLEVTAPAGSYISHVILSGSGSGWLVDMMSVDMAGGTTPVPEPATMLLLGSGLIGLAGIGCKKFKKS